MVGGSACQPARDLTDGELQELFYGKTFQFRTGQQSRHMIPESGPQQQRALKNQVTKEMEREVGTLQGLMLRHFREIADAKNFFSVPKKLFESLSAQTLDLAITSGFDFQSTGSALPLQDRGALALQPISGPTKSLLIAHQQDRDDFVAAQPETTVRFEPLVTHGTSDLAWIDGEQVFFRVTHAAPNRLKRPTRSIDSLRPDDLSIRLYRVCKLSECNQQVWLQQEGYHDVWCTALLTSWNDVDGSKLVSQFLEWQVYPHAEVKLSV